MKFADGKYLTVQKGLVAFFGAPEVVVQVEETLNTGLVNTDFNFAVRATARREDAGGFTRRVELWDWTKNSGAGGWDLLGTQTGYEDYMLTSFGELSTWADISKYVNVTTRVMRARLTAKQGLVPNNSPWKIGVEQLRMMVKP